MENDRGEPLIETEGLTKYFDLSVGVVDRIMGREPQPVRAVEDVDLRIERGDVMGIAGESGCGKTTLGKLLVKLHGPTSGSIRFDGEDVTAMTGERERRFRKRVQMIFQDPFESLNPRVTVADAVMEPLKINDMLDTYRERRERVTEVLNDVGLRPAEAYLNSFPQELSGGERQRVAIARALVVDPEFIVADEPVSMLDVSIRAGVLNLMKRLQDEYGLTYLFISHDLSLIRYMCDRTAIMYLGEIIEQGPTDEVVTDPKHPYTEALFDAVPEADPSVERTRANVTGEVPSPRSPPDACRFHPRCAYIIPPDDWRGDQDAFRRAFQFKSRVRDGDLDPEAVADEPDPADALVRRGLVLDVPEEHRTEAEKEMAGRGIAPRELDLPGEVERALRQASEAVLDGDRERAMAALEGTVSTVCEREHPDPRPAGEQAVSCHLYDAAESEPPAPEPTD